LRLSQKVIRDPLALLSAAAEKFGRDDGGWAGKKRGRAAIIKSSPVAQSVQTFVCVRGCITRQWRLICGERVSRDAPGSFEKDE